MFYSYTMPRYQESVTRTIGPLVIFKHRNCLTCCFTFMINNRGLVGTVRHSDSLYGKD